MAQSKQKRRRKHRGTQGGRVDRRGRTTRPLNRQEARDRLRQERLTTPPSWRGAVNRALIASGIFLGVVLLIGQPLLPGIGLAAFMLAVYIPLGYMFDRVLYNRRQRKR